MQTIKVSELKPHPLNSKFFDDITGDSWNLFLESIQTSGVIEPIIATDDKVIVSGHQRIRACKELGIDEVPVVFHSYTNDEDVLLAMIESNDMRRGSVGGSEKKLSARLKETAWLHYFASSRKHEAAPASKKRTVDELLAMNPRDIAYFDFIDEVKNLDADSMLTLIRRLGLDEYIANYTHVYIQKNRPGYEAEKKAAVKVYNAQQESEITTEQEECIKSAVKRRIDALIGKNFSYKAFAEPAFRRRCYSDAVKNAGLGWPYRMTLQKNYDYVIFYINTWFPKGGVTKLLEEIEQNRKRKA